MKDGLRVFLALALSLTAVPLTAQPTSSQEGFGEQVDVHVVNVDAFVTGKDGNPVPGLQKTDFEILEDGKRVEVSYFEEIDRGRPQSVPAAAQPGTAGTPEPAAPAPADALQLVVYVDNQHIRAANRARVLTQLREVLNGGLLRPGDRAMVVTFDEGLRIPQPFTADRAALLRALDVVEQMPARGDNLVRARRTALENTFMLLETAAGMSYAGMAGSGAGRRRPGRLGEGGGDGEGSEESEEGGGAPTHVEPICRMDVPEPVRAYAQATRQEVLASIASLKALVSSLAGLPGRKALLHVSDGLPLTPGEELFQALFLLCGGGGAADGIGGLDPAGASNSGYRAESALIDAQSYSTAKDWTLLAAYANTHRVTLYTLQASGLETLSASAADLGTDERHLQLISVDSVEMQNRQGSLSVMALDTGGRPIFNANDVRPDLARMRGDFDRYYSLGFTPRRAGDGREHRIEVRLKRSGLRVRHPRSYRDKQPLEIAADRTLAALFHGQEENPLEVLLDVGEARPQGASFQVPLRLRIPLHKLSFQDDQVDLTGKVRLLVALQGPNGETSRVRQVEIPLKISRDKALLALGRHYLYELTLTLSEGGQRVAVAIRDDGSSLTSVLARDIQVGQKGSTR